MRKPLFLVFTALQSISTFAQKPEPIYSFVQGNKPLAWYKEQAALWKKETEDHPGDANAWYNSYRVTRNILHDDTTDKRPSMEKWTDVLKIVGQMEKTVPTSFEYYYCKWSVSRHDFSQVEYLRKAASLGENKTVHYPDMIGLGEIERDSRLKKEYCDKWFESGEVSPGLLNYSYNVLIGLKPDAIILTSGDNDTYPVWVLQETKGIRKDVTMLNTSMLYIKEYRTKIFRELGIKELSYEIGGDSSLPWEKEQARYRKDLFNAIAHNSLHRPVYIAVTVGKQNYEFAEDKLYLTGLAYEYANGQIDNMTTMRHNAQELFALDYLDKSFAKDLYEYQVSCLNYNYLVMMLKLYEEYKKDGETQRAKWMMEKALLIVKGKPEENEVRTYFNQKK